MEDNKEKIETYGVETLYGTRDAGELVKRSVYKVKRADNTNTYDRVHFETDSKMIHDATNTAAPDMVARRDSTGSIEFYDLKANRNVTIGSNTTIGGTLSVAGTSSLGGKVTANNGAEIKNGLNVSSGGTTLASTLTVNGTTSLNNNVSINGNKKLTLSGGSDIYLTEGSEVHYEGKRMMSFEKDVNGNAITIGGGARTVLGSGESSEAFLTSSGVLATDENLHLTSDQGVKILTNINAGWASRKTVEVTTSGGVTADGTINSKSNLVVSTTGSIGTNLTVGGTATVNGATTLKNTLGVSGKSTLTGGADIATALNVTNASATIDLDATVKRNLAVTGTSTLTGVVNAANNVNLTGGALNIKGAELRTGGTDNKALVISATDETLYLRASKADGATSGELRVNKTNVNINKPTTVTGNIEASGDAIGANVVAKNGQLKTTKNSLLTTLSSESTSTFDINTAAATVKINKPTTVAGTVTATGEVVVGTNLKSPGQTVSKGAVGANTKVKFEGDSTVSGFYFNKPIELPSGAAVSPNFNADKVDGCDVNDSSTATTSLWTANKIDSTKANKSITISAGEGMVGGGNLSANRTISHYIPTQVAQTFTTLPTEMIKAINFDKFGHGASVTTVDMAGIFATPEEVAQQVANANAVVRSQYVTHTELNPDGTVKGPSRNTVNNLNMKNYSIDYNNSKSCIEFTFI